MPNELFAPIKREHVLEALRLIAQDFDSIPRARRRTNWLLHHEGLTFPPKYVLSEASKYAKMKPLLWNDFRGGKPTNQHLINLNFKVQPTPAHAEYLARKATATP